MEYCTDNIGTWITDRYGVKVYLDEKEAADLRQKLNNKEILFDSINMLTFAECAMRHTPEFRIEGEWWIIATFVIENNAETYAETTQVSMGWRSKTTTLYNKKTGKKYYGVFLKGNADGFSKLRLVAGG